MTTSLLAVARRVPGYRHIRRRGVRALRALLRQPRVAALVHGSVDRGSSGRAVPMDIRAGRYFDGQGRGLPIVVFVALGLSPGDAETLADTVERAQMATGTFRPLVVIDSGEFGPFRVRDYAVERLMPRQAYDALGQATTYEEYVVDRVSSIARAYRARSVVPLAAGAGSMEPWLVRLVGCTSS